MHRLTRISYNSSGWLRPTGEAAKQETGTTYNRTNGFGHEDWLFRNEWQVGGWRYAFIQGVGKSRELLLKEGQPFDLTLFTVEPDRRRRYVAHILQAEVLDDAQAEDALRSFRQAGWLAQMEDEIRSVGGNPKALGDAKWAKHVLNLRYRLGNLNVLAPDEFAEPTDAVQKLQRYQLVHVDSGQLDAAPTSVRKKRVGVELPPNVSTHIRRGSGSVVVSPEHAKMQSRLMAELRQEAQKFDKTRIVREDDFVDVVMETSSDIYLYEIKSDLRAMTVLRLAIGQLLEYSHRRSNPNKKTIHLIAVGRSNMNEFEAGYFAYLKSVCSAPLSYRVIPI